jgi:hypothetical protein
MTRLKTASKVSRIASGIILIALGFCVSCLALGGYFSGKIPSDEAVIQWFHANKKTLDNLLDMVMADDKKVTHVGRGIVELRPGTSLSEARKQEYLRKLQEIRADSFSYTRDEGAVVGLWTDAPSIIASITTSRRYKNVEYIEDIKKWHYLERLKPSLDGLEADHQDTMWLRHIEGKWYIVYMKD